MKDIKFRGLTKEGRSKWVYGWYFKRYQGETIVDGLMQKVFKAVILGEGKYYSAEVLPETVGQFTGLKDKNGKEVYEGNIIKGIWQVDHRTAVIGIVKYYPAFGLYALENDEGNIVSVIWEGCEIIGNIHENPELLK